MAITATMCQIIDAHAAGQAVGTTHVQVLVTFSGPELSSPDTRMIEFDIDLAQAPNALQTAFGGALRSAGQALNYSIPSNAVNVFAFTKA